MRKIFAAALIALTAALGCNDTKHASGDKMHHDCVVCAKHGNHMDVDIDSDTPRSSHNGKTYYFCEESCRVAFDKNPEEFVSQK